MHQEREYPARLSGTQLTNPDFAAFGAAFGAKVWTVETTEALVEALEAARETGGIRLIHARTEMETLSAGGATVTGLRNRQ